MVAVTAAAVGCVADPPAPTTPRSAPMSAASPVPVPATRSPAAGPAPAVVSEVTAADLGATWRPECPVPPTGLRRITLSYLDVGGRPQRGDLVVAADLVDDTIDVFAQLYRLRYPITRMRTVDHYPGADDETSMRDDNTSAFNCRRLASGRWSQHALGRAVDVNPLLNPYVGSDGVQPATGTPYLDRGRTDPGMLHAGDPVVTAFEARGWQWGGKWRAPKDYQHFEKR